MLGLMTLIMYASLFFPVGLVKEKVTVAITAALSGAVLLSSINSQLGGIGHVIAVKYIFYAIFILCLVCMVSVLAAEQLHGQSVGRACICLHIVFTQHAMARDVLTGLIPRREQYA